MDQADPVAPAETDDPVQRLVAELNQLRISAGKPSYRQLADRTYYSRSALWRATRSSRQPSRDITLALACACGGDRAEWDRKWSAMRAQASANAAATGPGRAAPSVAEATRPAQAPLARRRWPGRSATILAIAAVAAGAAVIAISQSVAAPSAGPLRKDTPFTRPADGDDPYVGKCATDEQRFQYRNLYWPDHQLYGWLELYHSRLCDASWGYIFGPNSTRWQVTIVARRLPDNTIAPSISNENAPPNSWGNVLTTIRGSCVRVEAYITVGATRGPAAVTSCLPDQQGTTVGPPPTPAPPPPPQYANRTRLPACPPPARTSSRPAGSRRPGTRSHRAPGHAPGAATDANPANR
jgi:hypothetical protein